MEHDLKPRVQKSKIKSHFLKMARHKLQSVNITSKQVRPKKKFQSEEIKAG